MFRFLAITNRFLCKGGPLIQAVKEAVGEGVEAVLLREQALDDHILYKVAIQFSRILETRDVPLLIAHRVDVALAVSAQGVQLGASSLPVKVARSLLGSEALIGFSAHSIEEALQAQDQGVDYVTLSPIFPTRSKPLARPLGLDYLQEAVAKVQLPVLALGGLDPSNVEEAMGRGAHGVAVMSALWKGDPGRMAGEIKERIKETMRS